MLKSLVGCLVAGLVTCSSVAATEIVGGADGISAVGVPAAAISMNLAGPDTFQQGNTSFSFTSDTGFSDGVYRYQLIGELKEAVQNRARVSLDSGRAQGARPTNKPTGIIEEGSFRIVAGAVLSGDGDIQEN